MTALRDGPTVEESGSQVKTFHDTFKMVRLIPFVIAVLAIVVLTFVEGSITDRWVDVNQESAYCATLLRQIPKKIGDWEGKDQEV